MPLLSSPVAYPPSSSPPQQGEPRKRSLIKDDFYPSKRQALSSNGNDTGNPQPSKPPAKIAHLGDLENLPSIPPARKGPFVDDDDDDEVLNLNRVRTPPIAQSLAQEGLPIQENANILEDPFLMRNPASTSNFSIPRQNACAKSSSGKPFYLRGKEKNAPIAFERLIAERSTTAAGRATKSYYGIDIHSLIDDSKNAKPRTQASEPPPAAKPTQPSTESAPLSRAAQRRKNMLWTEKYRARKYFDLVGDERTHRDVLRWVKNWDPIVFPGNVKPKPLRKPVPGQEAEVAKPHRKILLLTGPPGLGKTTLAHVCARQAGYEVVEINASDERTGQVVKGRIRDCVGTENVKGVNTNTEQGKVRKAGRPVCVVVDEVDGVVTGAGGGGDGGFVKALIDLVTLDQNNRGGKVTLSVGGTFTKSKKKKGDNFRLLRPMILICNDVYHPSLRPLRSSGLAEIIHIRKPPLDKVTARLKSIFDKEGIPSDSDGVRRLCECAWGVTSQSDGQSKATGDGDMRGILVVGEWAAAKLRAETRQDSPSRLTKQWVEDNMTEGLAHGGGGPRGVGRGGAKEAVERVFLEGAGFAKPTLPIPTEEELKDKNLTSTFGVSEGTKKHAMERLREIVDMSGECDRIVTDCFALYPSHPFQDDTFLSKPNAACDWLHFHDRLSSKVIGAQEWELGGYLSQSVLGLHHLFASSAASRRAWGDQPRWGDNDVAAEEDLTPFTGLRADYEASEALKQNKAVLQGLHSTLSIPLHRSFRSAAVLSTDLVPHVMKMLTPDVKPIVVGGSGDQAGIASCRKEGEKRMVERAVGVMDALRVTFERARVEVIGRSGVSSHIYRMEP